jgi:putative ABC transport system permease protein
MLFATKEIRRAKVRFGLLAGAVGLLVFLILFQQALLGSLVTSFVGAIRNQSATVLVYGTDARKNIAGSIITPPQQAGIEAVGEVGASAPLGEGTFTLVADGQDTDATIFGYRPGGPGEPTNVVSGRQPERPGEALASKEDESKGFAIGDVVTPAAADVPITIVGLTEQSRYSVAPTLWVTFDFFGELRRAVNPDATAVLPSVIAVAPADGANPEAAAAAINAQVDGVDALTRSQAAAESPGVAQVDQSFQLILWLVRGVVLLVIGFFFVILTVQKQPSLNLLRAIGASGSYLVGSLGVQILYVLGLGIIVGVLLTYGTLAAASAGLPLSISTADVVFNVVLVLVLGLVGSLVSILRVLRIDPVDAVQRPGLGGLE